MRRGRGNRRSLPWSFSVAAQPNEDARANLERSTHALLDLVAPFARVSDIEVVTAERGDDAFKFIGGEVARIGEAFSSQETIHRVSVTLDLAVNDGREIWFYGGATITLR